MKVLILGQSSIASRRAFPALNKLDCINSIDIASRRDVDQNAFDGVKFHASYKGYELGLHKSDAELVYVSLHNSDHAYWAEAAIRLNKHVVVDKPAFLDLPTAVRLLSLAAQHNVCLAEATVFCDHPHVETLLKILNADGGVSRLVTVFSIPPLPLENFRNHKELGGGAFYDLAPYAAACSRLFFADDPQSIFCKFLSRNEVTGADMAFSVMASYSGGRCLLGHFGFDTEYQNYISAFGPGVAASVGRFFTPPVAIESPIIVTRNNEKSIITAQAGDSFELFFDRLCTAIKQKDWAEFSSALSRDAHFTNRLKASVQGEDS